MIFKFKGEEMSALLGSLVSAVFMKQYTNNTREQSAFPGILKCAKIKLCYLIRPEDSPEVQKQHKVSVIGTKKVT